jgi:hypothetical protein
MDSKNFGEASSTVGQRIGCHFKLLRFLWVAFFSEYFQKSPRIGFPTVPGPCEWQCFGVSTVRLRSSWKTRPTPALKWHDSAL